MRRTCFWAGDTYAPKLKVRARDGRTLPIQQYLQGAFLDMFDIVAAKLGGLDGVLGFEVCPQSYFPLLSAQFNLTDNE